MKRIIFALVLCISAHAYADETRREGIIARIVAAQGVQQMFEQQQAHAKASAAEFGKNLFQKMLSDLGVPENQANPKLQKAFSDYMDRCSSMFSASELVATWSSYYGKDMSEEDLTQVLAYYESPIGKKDVQASQAAMIGFTRAIEVEAQKRLQQSISQLIADIKVASEK